MVLHSMEEAREIERGERECAGSQDPALDAVAGLSTSSLSAGIATLRTALDELEAELEGPRDRSGGRPGGTVRPEAR
ncbi:MAG: hypothetical protein H0U03_03370 [Actinobacteria bacterium]|nr:hypothetical protein [Actinomycetota bacterium]